MNESEYAQNDNGLLYFSHRGLKGDLIVSVTINMKNAAVSVDQYV